MAVVQAQQFLGALFLSPGGVMNSRGALHHLFASQSPEHAFHQTLLTHAPRIQSSEWPNDIGHVMFATSPGSRNARMIEDCMDVNEIKLPNVVVEPGGHWL